MTATPGAIFSTRTIGLLIAVGAIAFLATVLLEAFSDPTPSNQRSGTNSHSVSAIGHFAFAELLRDAGMTVLISGSRSPEKAGPNDVLVVAEPPIHTVSSGEISYMLQASRVLLILPKRTGIPDGDNPDWIKHATLKPLNEVGTVLSEVSGVAQLIRRAELGGGVSAVAGLQPMTTSPQLIRSGTVDPIIEHENGVLVGSVVRAGTTIWILSDPDIVSNHGLLNGDNAEFARAIIERLRGPGGAVVIDETLHGFRIEPSLIRAFLTLPFVVTTILFGATIIVLAWASIGRFGSPIPARPKRQAGKFTLIDNIAALLAFGGNHVEIARRFLAQTTHTIAQTFHIPHHLGDDQRAEWLDRIGRSRKVADSLKTLQQQARTLHRSKRPLDSDILALAARTFRWNQEMMYGPRRDPNA